MVKKFLFSTVLTTLVAFSVAAVAEETSQPQGQVTTKKKAVKVMHHKKVKQDDAYSPKHHHHHMHAPTVVKQTEEMVVFAEPKSHVHDNVKHDALINNDGLAVKVGGKVDIQYGIIDQESAFKQPSNNTNLPQVDQNSPANMPVYGSAYANQNAMVSNGELNFSATKDDFNGNKYGLEITANANTSPAASGNPNFASKVYMFLENNSGRFELGANDGASEALSISAASIAKATGGIDGDASSWVSYGAVVGDKNVILNDTFLVTPSLPYASQHAKKANKLTYYTPTYNGFKAGFSFVQDVTVQGTLYEALSFKGSGYKNVLEGGISYENKTNDIGVGISATGQMGEARDAYYTGGQTPASYTLNRLAAWQVGGKVSFDAFTIAASYGDWGKSGTLKTVTTPKKATYWTAGIAYDHKDQGGVSLTYMNSQRKGAFSMAAADYILADANKDTFNAATNKFESFSLGAEYKAMPGFMPYAEVTSFNYKTNLTGAKTNKGTVVLGGVKLNF